MAHFERSDRGGRPAQWRRRQQRWSGTDHAHNDNRLGGFHYDPCRTGHRPLHPAIQHELTLKHMAEDCSSVKSQLLKLKSLLQMDDGEITPESLDSSEDDSRAQQMEELMKEVAHLREELKNKEKIITRLTHQPHQQSPVRCQCHQQKSGVKGERRTHHDKSTQTVRRPPHHHPAAVPTPLLSPWQCQYQTAPRASMPQRRQRVEHLVHYFRDTACLKYFSPSVTSPTSPSFREN
uniref:Serine-rich coiled-coil domain-containing protein 2-like n=1 Tax=Sinocyclocheilus grahami TaxID=75366 RepID=A0A672P058_SINGR